MSMSFSSPSVGTRFPGGMSSFQYRPTNTILLEPVAEDLSGEMAEPELRLTESALSERLAAARTAGFTEAETKMRQEFEQSAELQLSRMTQAIAGFDRHQKDYFARVEGEVVKLALSIAGKILHREAQVDPMLVAAIVHLALGQLKEGSAATIRVRPEAANRWREHFTVKATNLSVKVIEDFELEHGDCVLETELGTVNFSLDAQLKEVERGFFDVLAQRPKV